MNKFLFSALLLLLSFSSINLNAQCFNSTDCDDDGILNTADLDDDNDGILDAVEYGNCLTNIVDTLVNDDFGTGARTTNPFTNYCYEDGTGTNPCTGFPGSTDVNDGEYAVVQFPNPDASGFGTWTTQGDHTGDVGGRMMVVNASLAADEFYRRTIDVAPNSNVNANFWVLNVINPGNNLILPNITFLLETTGGVGIDSISSGNIPENGTWTDISLQINPGNNTQVQFVLRNNAPGGGGNDLAIDDVFVFQTPCDTDNDGIPNYSDLDSDNDGCPDAIEGAGTFTIANISNDTLTGGVGSNGVPTAAGAGQGVGASALASTVVCCDASVSGWADSDGDNVADICDLDNDNDGILDSLESTLTSCITLPAPDGIEDLASPIGRWEVLLYTGMYGVPGSTYPNDRAPDGTLGIPLLHEQGYSTYGDSLYTFNDPSIATTDDVTPSLLAGGDVTLMTNPTNGAFSTTNGVWQIHYKREMVRNGIITIGEAGEYFDDHAELYVNGVLVDIILGWYPSLPASEIITAPVNAGDEVEIRLTNVGTLGGFVVSIKTLEFVTDTDGDGLSDDCDTDSDNDGCPDALEGAGNFTAASILNDTLTGGVDSNGIPNVASPGQATTAAVTDSLDATACGIPDIITLDDATSTPEETLVNIIILTNDTVQDTEIDTATAISTINPTGNGMVSINSNGTIDYTPNTNFNGLDTITYTLCDTTSSPNTVCDTAMVFITVNPVNDPPQAVDDTDNTNEDTPVIVDVTNNDSDSLDILGNIDPTSVDTVAGAGPSNGTISVNPVTGDVSYTPNTGFNGTDNFDYLVCDDGNPLPAMCDTATVTITVAPVNDPPQAVDDTDNTNEDTPVIVDVTNNDSDSLDILGNIDPTSVDTVAGAGPSNGTISVNPVTGDVTYTPNTGFNGTDNFDYLVCDDGNPLPAMCDTATVTITVAPVNDPPQAVNDVDSTNENTPVTIDVTDNDSDNLDPLGNIDPTSVDTISGSSPLNGTLSINPTTGDITYTPNPGFNGIDSFEYLVCDDGNPLPAMCDTASVSITVNAVNDPPQVLDDAGTTFENNPVTVDVVANDNDNLDPLGNIDPTTVDTVTVPLNGNFTINPTTGAVTYTPNPGYSGLDVFQYSVCDDGFPLPAICDTATVTITIIATNDPPTIMQPPVVVPEDSTITFCPTISDPDLGDVLTVSACSAPFNGNAVTAIGNCITYTPNPGYNGLDSMCVVVCDNGNPSPRLCDSVMVPITVTPVNDPPVAVDEVVTTPEDIPVTICPVFTDVDGLNDSISSVTACMPIAINGSVSITANDSCIIYTPNNNFVGTDEICYIVCDAGGLCDTATITITVTPVNDTIPVTVPEDSMVTICTDTTTNLGGPITSTQLCDLGDNGNTITTTVSCVEYTPDSDYVGEDTICVITCNGTLCDTTIITITVTPVNDPPLAEDTTVTTPEDEMITICPVFTDIDGIDTLITAVDCGTTTGTATINANTFCIDYTPATNFVGTDEVCYIVCDAAGLCDTATVTINVTPVTDTTYVSVPEDSMVTVCTDSVVNLGGTPAVTLCGGPNDGMASLPGLPNGSCVEYTPTAGFIGMDTMCLISCVGPVCDTTITIITITPVNDPPVAMDTTVSTPEDEMITICPVFTDIDGIDTLITAVDCGTTTGTATINANTFCIDYTPAANFVGMDEVCYIVCDAAGLCDTATVTINVTPVTDTTYVSVPEDSMVTVCTDSVVNLGGTPAVTLCGGPNDGMASLPGLPNGSCVEYTPTAGFIGMDTMCLISCVGPVCDTTITIITITPVNDPPVAMDTTVSTPEDEMITICPVFTDIDGIDTLITAVDCGTTTGTATINANTFCIDYTPAANFVGTDQVCYIVCDAAGLCDTATVTINVTPVTDTTYVTVPEDSMVTVCTDSVVNLGGTPAVTLCGGPNDGMASLPGLPNGSCVEYTPTAGFIGMDTMCLISCVGPVCDTTITIITITPVNDPPLAEDTTVTTPEDEMITICPVFTDIDGIDTLITAVDCGTTTGTATINANTFCIDYTPATNFVGTDEVCYIVCDAAGLCDTATVTINVTPVTDTTYVTVPEDSMVTVCTDSVVNLGGTPAVTLCGGPNDGMVSLPGLPNGSCVEYAPTAGFIGMDTMCLISCVGPVCDTTITIITITPVNDPPVAMDTTVTTPEDEMITICPVFTDIDGIDTLITAVDCGTTTGTATINANTFCIDYTPAANFVGTDQVCYIVCDAAGLCDTATVTINVTPVTDTTYVSVPEDSMVTVCTDSVVNLGGTPAVTLCGGPNDGMASLPGLPNGSCVEYTPTAGFIGMDTMCLISCVGPVCDTTITIITITPVNDPPVAMDTTVSTPEDEMITICPVFTDIDGIDTLITAVDCGTTTGTATINANTFCIDYTPATNFVGTDEVCYIVCDAAGLCDTATVTINVTPVTDTIPVTLPEDSMVTVCLDSVVNLGGTPTATTLCGGPNDGMASLPGLPNGSCVTYSPASNFNGMDTMCVISCIGVFPNEICDTTIITITVIPVNDPPVVVDDSETTDEDTDVDIIVLNNDSDVEGPLDTTSVTIVTPPTDGTLTIVNGIITFDPDTNFNGMDTFTYSVCDNGTPLPVICDTAEVIITVLPVNDAPVAINDTTSTLEDTDVTVQVVTTNDTDVDGNLDENIDLDLTVPGVQPTVSTPNGTYTNDGNGNVTFSPVLNFNGLDSTQYVVCDDGTPLPSMCDTAWIYVDVIPVNDPPVVVDDSETTDEDTDVDIIVLNNDSDVEGPLDTTSVTIVTPPTDGTLTIVNGVITFDPDTNFNGMDTFTYSVCDNGTPLPVICDTAEVIITVLPVNDAPVAINDTTSTLEDTDVTVQVVTTNDTDVDGNLDENIDLDLTVPGVQPTVSTPNGTYTNDGNGNVTFSPVLNFNGLDSTQYVVCDDGTPLPSMCDTAWIYVDVIPVNDPPVVVDDSETTDEDTDVDIIVLNNDSDVEGPLDTTSVTIVTPPTDGTLTIVNGVITFDPDTNFNGMDTFTYSVCDNGTPLPVICDTAEVIITVLPVNDAPVAINDTTSTLEDTDVTVQVVTTNDTDVDGNLDENIDLDLTVPGVQPTVSTPNGTYTNDGNGNVTFSPVLNFNGLDSTQYVVCDDGTPLPSMCDTAWIYVDVIPVNDPPVVVDDSETTDEDTDVDIIVLNNDSDVEGPLDTTSVTIVTPPTDGTLTIVNGVITFDPDTNFNGMDTFTYSVCDNGTPLPVICDTAEVIITVLPVNDAPVAINDTTSTLEDTDVTVQVVTTNDTDVDGNLDENIDLDLTVPGVQPTVSTPNGTYTNDGNGNVTFSPVLNFNGLDSTQYVVCDDGTPLPSMCDTAWIYVDVIPVNDPPVVVDDSETTEEDTDVDIIVLNNDSDVEGPLDTASVTIVTPPTDGTLTIVNGVITFDPDTNFNGMDTFTYSVCDNGTPLPVICDTAEVIITVLPVNDAPVAINDTTSTLEDTDVTVQVVTTNDTDVDGNLITNIDLDLTVPGIQPTVSTPNGTYMNDGNGNVTFSPVLNWNGLDSTQYVVCDDGTPLPSLCDTAWIYVDVIPVNDPPVVVDDSETTDEDTDVDIIVLNNDSDVEGPLDTTSVTIVTPPTDGTLTIVNGVITFDPDTNFNGMDTFTYSVCDNGTPLPVICDTAEVIITVLPVNDQPVAINDTTSTLEDTDVTVQVVTTNDTDVDGNLITNIDLDLTVPGIQPTVSTPNGTYMNDGNGNVTFSPVLNWNGLDSTQYVVCDDGTPLPSLCDTAWIYVNVIPVNDPPIIVDDAAITNEDTDVTIDVLVNDSDVEGPLDSTSVMIIDSTTNGTLTVDPITGVVTFDPDTNFNGMDTFTYSVCDNGTPLPVICDTAEVIITVLPVNDPPIAVNDLDTTFEEIPTGPIVVVANDSDVDGNIVSNSVDFDLDPTNPGIDNQETIPEGVWTIDGVGNVIFTPTLNFNGTVTIDYLVCDDGTPLPSLCDTATITVVVMPVNDAPVALNDVDTVIEDQTVNVDVVANDSDPFDPLGNIDSTTVTVITPPLSGTTGVPTATGEVPYTPNPNFNGVDSFQYSVCDDGNPLPALCDTAWAVITVLPENDPPVAIDDTSATVENTPVVIDVINNDNPDSDPLDPLGNIDPTTVGEVTPPMNGSISINPITGFITYTPDPGFFGTDEFEYVVCDDGNPLPSECDTALVTVTVLIDSDDDGIPNDVNPWFQDDIDDDNDGIVDILEGTGDTDGDGISDDLDLDSDGDGIPDNVEAQTTEGYQVPTGVDTDGDGLDDAYDASENVSPTLSIGIVPIDTDEDNSPDYVDEDSDNDSVLDLIEGNDANADGIADIDPSGIDSDNDGLDDAFDTTDGYSDPNGILVSTNPGDDMPDTDGTEDLDYRDTDDDGDGVPTLVEVGIYEDCDNDGIPNYLDVDLCLPIIPEGISPNGDGLNDAWVIEGLEYFPDHSIWIFNRWGNKVYETNAYNNDWRGTNEFGVAIANENLPEGTYFYIFESGIEGQEPFKGFIYITK